MKYNIPRGFAINSAGELAEVFCEWCRKTTAPDGPVHVYAEDLARETGQGSWVICVECADGPGRPRGSPPPPPPPELL